MSWLHLAWLYMASLGGLAWAGLGGLDGPAMHGSARDFQIY